MEQRKSKIGKLLFGIMDMIIVFIFLFPFLWMLSVSLQSEKEITTIPLTLIPKVPQWKNYVEAFASAPFLLYLRNSVLVILGVVVIQLLVMVPAHMRSQGMQFAGKNLCFGLGHDRIYDTGTADILSDLSHDVEGRADEYTVAADFTVYDKCVWHFSAPAVFHADSGRTA